MNNKVRVAIADFPPLISPGKKPSGFEIELWEMVAKKAGIDFEYEVHHFKNLIPLLAEKKINVALSGISVNEEREEIIDFSHPTLDSGLLIAVNPDKNDMNFWSTIVRIIHTSRGLFGSASLALVGFVIFFSHAIWFLEYGSEVFNKNYVPGIFEAVWFLLASVTSVGYGDFIPATWPGKATAIIAIILGLSLFGLFLSQLTAFLTAKKLRGRIDSERDLGGKTIATVEGSTSEAYLKRRGIRTMTTINIKESVVRLRHDTVDAIVFDAPALLHLERGEKNTIETVGDIFDRQSYAIAVQQPSPILESINRALLTIKESGEYDALYRRWFGDDNRMKI